MKKRKNLRYESSIDKWIVDFGGRKDRKRKYFDSRTDAEQYMHSDEFLIGVGFKSAPEEVQEDSPSISVEEATQWYSDNVSSTKSRFSAKWEPKRLKEWASRNRGKTLKEISLKELLEERSYLLNKKGYLPQTVNRRLTVIKSFFKACCQAKLISSNPALELRKLPLPEPAQEEIVSEADQKKLLLASKPWVRNPIWFAMQTGARRNEIVNLRWGQIHLDEGYLVIEMSEGFETKSKRSRRIPLTPAMEDLFQGLHKEARLRGSVRSRDFVFVTTTGRRILPDRLTREAKKVMKRVLKRETGAVHVWRHSALTLMLQKGADIETVRKLAGHSSLTVTQRYVHSTDQTMLEAMQKLRSTSKVGGSVAIGGDR